MARPKSATHDIKRDAILDIAAQCFADRSYPAASMNEIATACGTSKARLYHYYDSKEAILFDLMDRYTQRLLSLIALTDATAQRRNLDDRAALHELIRAFLQEYESSATRHVAGVRVELGTRTIFNLLGPLSNPAGVKRQLVGVYARKWVAPLAETLGRLGSIRAWVVHGADGLDEITTTGATHVAEFKDGKVHEFDITPADAGLPQAKPQDLKGGTPAENAATMQALLKGANGPIRDVVLFNAAAVLVIADAAPDLKAGVVQAALAIDSGKAAAALAALVDISNRSGA
jgi:AcrR family transcriptional regulator